MKHTWGAFAREKVIKIFTDKKTIIDIGGGLRVAAERGNRYETENGWLRPYLAKVEYKILDKVPDFHPDIVGDIHALPFADNSIDAIFCIAILEHVEEPQRAVREMHRVLKPGGYCYIFAPFLYYYHAEHGYYQDFYRFTHDGVKYLTRDFTFVEMENTRGAFATVVNLLPFFSKRTGWADWIDRLFGKTKSKQTSGYNIFCIK